MKTRLSALFTPHQVINESGYNWARTNDPLGMNQVL